MKVLFPCLDSVIVNNLLAREIGLAEAAVLTELCKEIQKRGTNKDGHIAIARNEKQLTELFPFNKLSQTKKILEKLRDLGYIYISDNTMFETDVLWYMINWNKLKQLKSITVLTDGEIKDLHEPPPAKLIQPKDKEQSLRYKLLYAAYMKVCGWDQSISLTPRDRAECGNSVNDMMKRYPDHDTDAMVLMLSGVSLYIRSVLKWTTPIRPSTINRVWGDYVSHCKEFNNGLPLGVKE
jgi:hypothetical protein